MAICGPGNMETRLKRLEDAAGMNDGRDLIFGLDHWSDAPISFEPWERDQIPAFEEQANANLKAAGVIGENHKGEVRFMTHVICYPPGRPDEDERCAGVRPLLRQAGLNHLGEPLEQFNGSRRSG